MKTNFIKTTLLGSALAIGALTGCKKNEGSGDVPASGPDIWDRKYITLTGAFPDASNEAGNGGTMAYAVTTAQAADPNYEVNVFANGYVLRSARTARVQGSINGNFLYNIQYTGVDGGIFNKYKVEGGKDFVDTREEVTTASILTASPRWVVAADGIGIGVNGSAQVTGSTAGAGATFVDVKSIAKIAILDLNDPQITRQTEITVPFTAAQTKEGYQITRIDVPVLNKAKTKIFIGCNLGRINPAAIATMSTAATPTQQWGTLTPTLGTTTLVVDYPSLTYPTLIYSTKSTTNNHSYRTMTQYVGTDGNIYQATATGGSQILRISSTTNDYDPNFDFNLKTALGTANNVAIRAWRYIKDGIGLVLYTETNVQGGFLALVDLNANTATKLTTDNQTDIGYSGRSANVANNITAIVGAFGQFQNIGVIGDKFYVPMTPNGIDGNLYIIDSKLKTITKGAKLKNQSGSFYLGAY